MESLSPFLQGSCIPYKMSVYPGARCKTADALYWFDRRFRHRSALNKIAPYRRE